MKKQTATKKETKLPTKSESKKLTKAGQVKSHLVTKGTITSWEAIKLYKATRLSAIIHNLRCEGYNIKTQAINQKDINGNNCTFAKYVYTKGKMF